MEFILAQFFGLLASLALITSVQFKKKSHILILTIVSAISFTISFALLGAWSGAMICFVGTFVTLTIFLLEKYGRKVSWPIVLVFVVAKTVSWAFFYQTWYDVLPLVGTLFWLASVLQRNENRLRWILLVSSAAWIIYGIITAAYASVLADVLTIASTVIALIRYRKVADKQK